MMLEQHFDEEALIAILHSGGDAASRDPHLSACSLCAETLESYRVITEVLGEKEVWETIDDPRQQDEGAARSIAALRAFANAMEAEAPSADSLVEQLLASPRQWWVAKVERDQRYHTSAVLRRLIEVSETKIATMPVEAVEAAASAIAVSDWIEDTDDILQLRGAAYRQHAYAMFYTGDFNRAAESVATARSIFARCTVSEYALARLDIVESLVLSHQQRFEDAMNISRRAATVFRTFGDTQRYVSARIGEAYLLMQVHRVRDAAAVLQHIQQRYWSDIDVATRARLLSNIGGCQWNLGQIADAVQTLQIAVELHEESGNVAEAARAGYSIALLFAAHGKQRDAKERLSGAASEFDRLGMVHPAVVARLDLAEIFLLEKNFKEVDELCRTAIRQFETAGVAYSSEALTALTFLREAAEQRRATQETVWHVKTYIRRLPDEPALLFAPAPLPPA